jgi:hypothetical protein
MKKSYQLLIITATMFAACSKKDVTPPQVETLPAYINADKTLDANTSYLIDW